MLKECNIADFHQSLYKPIIQKLSFHLPHVRIFGTNRCDKMRKEALIARQDKKDVVKRRDYAERFTEKMHVQIQCQHFGGNRSLSMKGVAVQHFNIGVINLYVAQDNFNNISSVFLVTYLMTVCKMHILLLNTIRCC